ncbi:MAG: HAMP domain-containing sensor histidine kinase [Gemmatimonadota bacterium]|nr:HAMP domain-containing sensor histidine kinase [Gemmatimonadota bacterium]
MRLRNRFTLFFVTFVVAVSAFQGGLSYYLSQAALEDEIDRKLLDVAGVVGRVAFGGSDVLLGLRPDEEDAAAWQDRHKVLLRLVDRGYADDGDFFRWTPGDTTATLLVSVDPPDSVYIGQELSWVQPNVVDAVWEAYETGSSTTEPFRSPDGEKWYKRGIVSLGSGVFLGVLMPVDHLEPLGRLGWTVVALTAASAVLAALIGWRLAAGIASRLEVLSRGALRIQRGAVDRPFDLKGEDEIGRLARAMERMRTGIRRRDEQLRLMLSRVAHEIRNPLGGLELFAAAAQDTEDPKERRRILDRVRKEVLGLNAIIDEFLGFARPGRTEPQLHDVRQSVGEAVQLAEAELDRKGGSLQVDFPEKPLLAIADPLQVKRLVLNLLRNASHAGDSVWLEGAMVNGEVRVAIRDNGPGIPRELRERVFEPFVGDKAQGAGLGLAIVKEMAEANHGRVELVSDADEVDGVGGGAEFHVYLSGPEDPPGDGSRRTGALEDAAT